MFTKSAATVIHIMLHRHSVRGAGRLLIYFNNFSCFWIVFQLLFKRVVWAGIIVSRQGPTLFGGRELSNRRMNIKARAISHVSIVWSSVGRAPSVFRQKSGFGDATHSAPDFEHFAFVFGPNYIFSTFNIWCYTSVFHAVDIHVCILRKIIFNNLFVFMHVVRKHDEHVF